MNIAIRNLHRTGITGFAFHGYITELLRSGAVSHLYFDEDPFLTEAFVALRKQYGWKTLGLDRIKVIFREEELHADCDVLLNFASLPEDFTPAVKRFQGLKIFHLMDYFWSEPLSVKAARLKEYGVDYVFGYGSPDRYCEYFRRFAPEFSGRVIPLPFGFAPRFREIRPFHERLRKCVAVGSVRPLRFPDIDPQNWQEVADFHHPQAWFHPFRRQLVEHKKELASVMDSMLPEFPRYRDYDYDMVAKLNDYQLFTSDESIFFFPSAKAFEGPAAGTVMVCSDHACFRDFGFQDGVNCLMHAEGSVADFRKRVDAVIQDEERLAALAAAGRDFVVARYAHPVIARTLAAIISRLADVHRGVRAPDADLAEACYRLYRQEEPLPVTPPVRPLLEAAVRRRQWAWYVLGGGRCLVRAEAQRFWRRASRLVSRMVFRAWERSWKVVVTLARDTHPIDAWRKSCFQHLQPASLALAEPTDRERQAITRLRNDLEALAPTDPALPLDPPAKKWRLFTQMLRERCLNDDPRLFLSWEVIRSNMGYRANTRDLRFLRRSPLWEKLRPALREPSLTNRQPFFAWPETSENAVRQAFHIAQFQRKTGAMPTDFDVIVDFGGGYGSMARLIQGLGFRGTYIIFDWPEFLALQRFYLALAEVSAPIEVRPDALRAPTIAQVSDLEGLRRLLATLPASAKKLLIATWSLSEAPVPLRDEILSAVRPDAYLLAYQHSFGGIPNRPYFDRVAIDCPRVSWYDYSMAYIPAERNRYRIGMTRPL